MASTNLTADAQEAVLYWPEIADIPIIPADTRKKKIWLSKWQEIDFTNVNFRAKLANGDYDKGLAIRTGKTLSGKHYSIALDFDGWDAVTGWFGTWEQVIALSKQTIIEWHHDKGKIHVIYLAPLLSRIEKYILRIHFWRSDVRKMRCFPRPVFTKKGYLIQG